MSSHAGGWRATLRETVVALWGGRPTDPREILRHISPDLLMTLRLTIATVLGYLAVQLVKPGVTDLTAPLTALLVVQASAVGTVRMGLVRVGAVLTGVVVAVVFASWTGISWWSLGCVVAFGLLFGRLFRLHDQLLETPISAMLILGGSAPDIAAESRVLYTVIGTVVGMALAFAAPPPLPISSASKAVGEIADETADVLDRLSEALAMAPLTSHQISAQLARVRALSDDVTEARAAIISMRESRVMNPRALNTRDVAPVLTSGLESLEGCLLSVRAMLATLLPQAPDTESLDLGDVFTGSRTDSTADDVRQIFAAVLSDAGECVRGFGALIEAEAAGQVEQAEHALAHSMEVLRETRAILAELMIVDTNNDPELWLLRGHTLGAVEQILHDLNLDDRARQRASWLEEEERRFAVPALLSDTLLHPERPLPRGLDRELRRAGPAIRRAGKDLSNRASRPRQSQSVGESQSLRDREGLRKNRRGT